MSEDNSPHMREIIEVLPPTEGQQSVQGSAYDAGLYYDTSPGDRVNWTGRSAYDAGINTDTSPNSRVDWPQPTPDSDSSGASAQGKHAAPE